MSSEPTSAAWSSTAASCSAKSATSSSVRSSRASRATCATSSVVRRSGTAASLRGPRRRSCPISARSSRRPQVGQRQLGEGPAIAAQVGWDHLEDRPTERLQAVALDDVAVVRARRRVPPEAVQLVADLPIGEGSVDEADETALAANDTTTLLRYSRFLGPITDRISARQVDAMTKARIHQVTDAVFASYVAS